MARTRLIHPGASIEEDVAVMSIAARLLWAYLPCHADREGRLKDSVFTIKAAVFPADTVDVNALLEELASARHIIRYQADGRRIIQIRNFRKYQSPHKNEVDSTFPAPPSHEDSRVVVNNHERSLPSVSVSGDLSGEISRPARDPAATGLWTANRWLEVFRAAWEKSNKGAFYGRGAGDSKALDTLQSSLEALPREGRLEAERRAPEMLAEFLGDDSAKARKERWQFSYFVLLFNGLRVEKPRAPEQPARCYWHAKNNRGASRNPLDTCPECREEKARNRGRVSEPAPLVTLKPPENPVTPEQFAELRALSKGTQATGPPDAVLPTTRGAA